MNNTQHLLHSELLDVSDMHWNASGTHAVLLLSNGSMCRWNPVTGESHLWTLPETTTAVRLLPLQRENDQGASVLTASAGSAGDTEGSASVVVDVCSMSEGATALTRQQRVELIFPVVDNTLTPTISLIAEHYQNHSQFVLVAHRYVTHGVSCGI